MRHFVPLDTGAGWGVCYRNFRGEFVPVMECTTLESAYEQSAQLTQQATAEAMKAAALYQASTNQGVRL